MTRSPLVCAALSLCAVGCTLANPPADHSRPISGSAFCAELADVGCDAFFGCCTTAVEETPATRAACLDRIGLICARSYSPFIGDPRTGYSEYEAARSLVEGRRIADECSDDVFAWFTLRDGLLSSLAGTVPGGGDCTPNSLGPGSMLDAAALFSCRDDLACALSGGSSPPRFNCLAPRALTEPCFLSFDCQDELYCAYDVDGRGACAPRQPDGAPCFDAAECESLACDAEGSGLCVRQSAEEFFCVLGGVTR